MSRPELISAAEFSEIGRRRMGLILGPWRAIESPLGWHIETDRCEPLQSQPIASLDPVLCAEPQRAEQVAQFIAHAPRDIARLLAGTIAANDRLRAVTAILREEPEGTVLSFAEEQLRRRLLAALKGVGE